ncbi:hypothetical protein JR316_0006198 [Psilocybe cubensis]|uniref:Uncharacterized protein n=1 Tax=Psilocybe cubensis TaxID=181762 RepID=A0ACB8H1C1_PSICU|nr:hypothetical protein JR316_0006198 [Psilocybe cubensis]KAH9481671.1 hypothetical protein JR316_0006198 [Psilocybe cubensis]
MPNQAPINWSEGSAFIQKGTIYASPNSKRVVLIPPPNQDFKEVFARKFTSTDASLHDLELEGFKQPIRWHDSYGWMAFFPLSPSFVSLPFKFLCWSPKLFYHRDGQINPRVPKQLPTWAMDTLEQRKWHDCKVNLILVAEKVRLWCRIPGTPPPVPQSLGYMLKHRTEEAAYHSINATGLHPDDSRKDNQLWFDETSSRKSSLDASSPANLWKVPVTQNGSQWVEWTPTNEAWYLECVEAILTRQAQPLTRGQWKTMLRGTPPSRKLQASASQRAQAFVDAHVSVVASFNGAPGYRSHA